MLCTILMGITLNIQRFNRLDKHHSVEEPSHYVKKQYAHKVAEGLSLQNGSLPGVDLIRFDSCRIEKQQTSGLSFGAFNILLIDKHKLALPLESGS